MSAQPPMSKTAIWLALFVTCSAAISYSATVDIHPGQDIPTIVSANPAGTTFIIYPGTYRLTEPIIPKNGDSFIGQTACAPPTTPCPAVISGSTVIGPLARFDGEYYEVTNQTQQGGTAVTVGREIICDPGYEGCIYPEDLFFDGVPYQHLDSYILPAIGPGQWWFDYINHIIYFYDNPAGHTVETSVLNNGFGGSANNVTIQYLTVKGFADMFPYGAIGAPPGNLVTQAANWMVHNCEVLLNHGYGVRLGFGMHIINNYIHDNGQIGIAGGIGSTSDPSTQSANAGILIQGNVINHNDYAHFNADFGSGGIKVGSTSGITIRGNIMQNNEGSGIHFDDYSENTFVDGNTVTGSLDADGIVMEMSFGPSTIRNNIVLRNGRRVYENHSVGQIGIHASTGANIYCNVLEIPLATGVSGFVIGAANRGYSEYPPYQYLVTAGNSFHHNSTIWDAGAVANGAITYLQDDALNQPNFFSVNARPDYNEYHLSSSQPAFVYDNNDSEKNARKTFPEYQAAGADVHGKADLNYTSGFPTVMITSPVDQTSFSNSVTVNATASDKSGINRVEFYVDWKLQTTVAGPPYSFNWTNGTSGSHVVAAMAYSNAGIRNCYAVTLTKQ